MKEGFEGKHGDRASRTGMLMLHALGLAADPDRVPNAIAEVYQIV